MHTLPIHSHMKIDLHIHTSRSDGRYAPEEVLRRCASAGLELVSLTDHDLGTSFPGGMHRINGKELYIIPGAEVSGLHDGREFHLLVYFSGPIPDEFKVFCKQQCVKRADRYVQAVKQLGIENLPMPDQAAKTGQRAITRFHLAQAMVSSGHSPSISHAFQHHIGNGNTVVPRVAVPFVEAIQFARKLGGITSWAHPPKDALKKYLSTFVEAGLQGLESLRPRTSSKERYRLRRMAQNQGLFITGGSDWHGWHDPPLGTFNVRPSDVTPFLDALSQVQ